MNHAMSKRERVQAAIAGREVDRLPISLWGHDFEREWSAEDLTDQTLAFARRYDLDWVKINPRFSYLMEAWGGVFLPMRNSDKEVSRPPRLPVRSSDDLARLHPVSPVSPPLAEQLVAARAIVRGLAADRPVVATLFSPLAILANLVEDESRPYNFWHNERLKGWFGTARDAVHEALRAISQTVTQYALEALNTGIDGFLYAPLGWASYDACTWPEYEEFGRLYDLPLLSALSDAEIKILHVCRDNNMLDRVLDYPVDVFHWDSSGTGNLSLSDATAKTDRALGGGLSIGLLADGSSHDVRDAVGSAVRSVGGRRLLLSGSCSVPPRAPEANLRAAVEALRNPG